MSKLQTHTPSGPGHGNVVQGHRAPTLGCNVSEADRGRSPRGLGVQGEKAAAREVRSHHLSSG